MLELDVRCTHPGKFMSAQDIFFAEECIPQVRFWNQLCFHKRRHILVALLNSQRKNFGGLLGVPDTTWKVSVYKELGVIIKPNRPENWNGVMDGPRSLLHVCLASLLRCQSRKSFFGGEVLVRDKLGCVVPEQKGV